MAADTVDAVVKTLGRGGRSTTRRLRLLGAYDSPPHDEHLARRYGILAREVLEIERADPGLAEPLVPGLPYRRSEAIYAVRSEMATTLDDVLSRRTRARLLGRDLTAAAADAVARLIAPELGWDTARTEQEVDTFRAALVHERVAADLPEQALDESIGA
jgi:glycerol-3-phosphate dehydrogenase